MADETPAQTPVPGSEGPADGQTADGTGEAPKGNKEARYRVERNEAREALAAAEARVVAFQRAEVERLAADALSQPGDLFTMSGNDVADYLDINGSVDPDKVAADVAAIVAERPGLKKRAPGGYDPTQGHGGRAPKAEPSWGFLLQT